MIRRHPRLLALALVGLLAALGVVQTAPHAALADNWCWGDPVISIDGQQTRILVGIQGNPATVAAAGMVAHITVVVPAGTRTSVVVPPATTPFLERLTVVTQANEHGNVQDNQRLPVLISTTFSRSIPAAGAASLAASAATVMQVTQPNGTVQTVSGRLSGSLVVRFTQ